jgi:hypothetical protein
LGLGDIARSGFRALLSFSTFAFNWSLSRYQNSWRVYLGISRASAGCVEDLAGSAEESSGLALDSPHSEHRLAHHNHHKRLNLFLDIMSIVDDIP